MAGWSGLEPFFRHKAKSLENADFSERSGQAAMFDLFSLRQS
jgi:hypothetical protein